MSLLYLDTNTPVAEGKVEFRVGGAEYFSDIETVIDELESGDKCYLMNWHIAEGFFFRQGEDNLSPSEPGLILRNKLASAVIRGVDVRILLWVNTNLFEPLYPLDNSPAFVAGTENLLDDLGDLEEDLLGGRVAMTAFEDAVRAGALSLETGVRRNNTLPFKDIMLFNLLTVHHWRSLDVPGHGALLRDRIVINTLDSVLGGCHAKFALVMTQTDDGARGTGYTGGIDFGINRYAAAPYHPWSAYDPDNGKHTLNYWHDVMASVQGVAAVQPLHDFFQTLWNENVQRKANYNPRVTAHYTDGTLQLDCVPPNADLIEDQVWDARDSHDTHLVQSLSTIPNTFQLFGTPENPGIGEPPIAAYPDGNFTLRDAVKKAIETAQHYIYVEDQAIQSLELYGLLVAALKAQPNLVVILVRGGDPADAAESAHDFQHIDEKIIREFRYERLLPAERGRLILYEANYTIHSKIFLIDDAVAIVGSAGFFTRAMTEELEHGIAVIDHVDDGSTWTVADFRRDLWHIHTGFPFSEAPYNDDLPASIALWKNPTTDFGNTEHGGRLVRYDWDAYVLQSFPEFWQDVPRLLAKRYLSSDELTVDEDLDLFIFEEYLLEQGQIVAHMMMYEAPFSSWLNPSGLPPDAVLPSLERNQVAVNQATRLSLAGPDAQRVEWTYVPLDTLDVDDAVALADSGDAFTVRFRSPGIKMILATIAGDATHTEQKIPFVVRVLESSGVQWVARYPTSRDLETLDDEFHDAVSGFLEALQAAGLSDPDVDILATYRPPERAYLMASCYQIAKKGVDPTKIKRELDHVAISWVHYDADGNVDLAASKAAALAMFQGYGIGKRGAVYPSNHMKGTAVDMKIQIDSPMTVIDNRGRTVEVRDQIGLVKVARTFGVKHLGGSNHWSLTGG